ncbi:MAG: hypothetical protein PHS17_19830, partial [Desulfobacterales bacterium]|nr:hypothetical protein [Desulfobacterales bacterium]
SISRIVAHAQKHKISFPFKNLFFNTQIHRDGLHAFIFAKTQLEHYNISSLWHYFAALDQNPDFLRSYPRFG